MDMYSTSKIIQRSGMKHPQRIVRALTTNAVKVLIVAWAKPVSYTHLTLPTNREV